MQVVVYFLFTWPHGVLSDSGVNRYISLSNCLLDLLTLGTTHQYEGLTSTLLKRQRKLLLPGLRENGFDYSVEFFSPFYEPLPRQTILA